MKSRRAMGYQYAFAAKILDDAGIDYVRDGYVALGLPVVELVSDTSDIGMQVSSSGSI